MTSLTVLTFMFSQPRKWKQLGYGFYRPEHVNALWRACGENIKIPHRFLCLTDQPKGVLCETSEVFPAIYVNGEDACYRRLRAFDAEWQRELGSEFVLMLDLDAVFLDDATRIIDDAMKYDFTILRGSTWPDGSLCSYYNGSAWLCRAGARPQFCNEFDPATFFAIRDRYKMPNGRRPHGSDQAWLSVCAGDAERTWGPGDGIAQYRSLNARSSIDPSIKLLFFAGRSKPWSNAVRIDAPQVFAAWKRYDDTPDIPEPTSAKILSGRARCACGTRVWHKGIPSRCPVCGMPAFALA